MLCVVPAVCAWLSLAGPQQLHACSTPAVAVLAEEPAAWHSGTLEGAADSWLSCGAHHSPGPAANRPSQCPTPAPRYTMRTCATVCHGRSDAHLVQLLWAPGEPCGGVSSWCMMPTTLAGGTPPGASCWSSCKRSGMPPAPRLPRDLFFFPDTATADLVSQVLHETADHGRQQEEEGIGNLLLRLRPCRGL